MLITASRQPATSSPKPSHCSANGRSRTRLCSSRLLAEATTEREGNLLFHVLLVVKCLPETRQSPIRDCGRMTLDLYRNLRRECHNFAGHEVKPGQCLKASR